MLRPTSALFGCAHHTMRIEILKSPLLLDFHENDQFYHFQLFVHYCKYQLNFHAKILRGEAYE